MPIEFKTINLKQDLSTCINFRRDSYQISFGNLKGFEADMESYLARMEKRIGYFPRGNCHLWLEGEIIGQTEMKFVEDPAVGYVSFFYLRPEFRGLGHGTALHVRAKNEFSAIGKTQLQLSVSPSNARALAFYKKMGWKNRGPNPGKEHMYLLTYNLEAS